MAVDLPDARQGAGLVRCAPKILRDGAALLARSATYLYASYELEVSGASAGINAPAPERAEAVSAAMAALVPVAREQHLLLDPGKGVTDVDLVPLREVDDRPALYHDARRRLTGQGAAAAAATYRPLEGRSVAIEFLDETGLAFAAAAVDAGARIVAVSTPQAGTATAPDGFDLAGLRAAHESRGDEAPADLVTEPGPAAEVLRVQTDVLAVGSRAGVVDHEVAAGLAADTLVPIGPAPVTARALAVLRRAGVTVLPDCISLGGTIPASGLTGPAPADEKAARAAGEQLVTAAAQEVLDHPAGPFLGACERAERFLSTWREELPFGRPLA